MPWQVAGRVEGGRRAEAGEARLRSRQTGSLLPEMLRGKSPCHGAESARGRPQGLALAVGGDACRGAGAVGLASSQQYRHAVSVREGANRTGLTLPTPPFLGGA